ncbi:hypothetical protein HDU91_003489 [Kappamyces sp. JEL0680]|nr:hypothetical protein HDU91_003489 [Kappamyces sp. JEL0680]
MPPMSVLAFDKLQQDALLFMIRMAGVTLMLHSAPILGSLFKHRAVVELKRLHARSVLHWHLAFLVLEAHRYWGKTALAKKNRYRLIGHAIAVLLFAYLNYFG